MAQSLHPYYRTALHEALLVKIKTRNSAAAADGYIITPDDILRLITKSSDLEIIKKNLYNQVYVFKASEIVESTEAGSDPKDLHQSFVKLGLLLAILNRYLLTSDADIFQFDLDTPENKYRTIDGHLSVDPQVCILPSTFQSLIDKQEGFDDPLIYNILINVDFVVKVLNAFLDSQGNIMLLDFFEDLFAEMERVTGNINKYELQYYEQTNSFTVLDRNYLKNEPKNKFPEFDVFGLRSIITNVDLVSQISSKMSSMVAISAQDSPFSSNMESTGFAALNKDLVNRQEGKVKDLTKEELLEIKEQAELTYEELLKKFEEDMGTLIYHLNSVYGLKIFNLSDSYYTSNIYENYCNMVIGKKNDPAYSFIIPFQLNLTLDGISGIKVLNSFRINKNILPSTYGGRKGVDVAFLVTGVEHTIDTKAWRTNIKTQIYNVNDKGAINSGKNYQAYWPTLATPSIASGAAGITGDRYKGTVRLSAQQTTDFFKDVYKGLGVATPNSYQLRFFEIWRQKEGAQAAWNPFNTTLKTTDSLTFNAAPVQNYPNKETGVDATVRTLKAKYYPDLLAAIKGIKNEEDVKNTMRVLNKSPWGTKFKDEKNIEAFYKQKLTDYMWSGPTVKR